MDDGTKKILRGVDPRKIIESSGPNIHLDFGPVGGEDNVREPKSPEELVGKMVFLPSDMGSLPQLL